MRESMGAGTAVVRPHWLALGSMWVAPTSLLSLDTLRNLLHKRGTQIKDFGNRLSRRILVQERGGSFRRFEEVA
jgi:hypothetical protein